MRACNFDYANTCPTIDKAIDNARDDIENFIDDLLYDACPLLPTEVRLKLTKENTEALYYKISPAFESCRKANEDMRHEAESQISDLCDTITNLEAELKYAMENADD